MWGSEKEPLDRLHQLTNAAIMIVITAQSEPSTGTNQRTMKDRWMASSRETVFCWVPVNPANHGG